MDPYEYEEVRLTMTIGGETFTAKGKRVLRQGWKAAYNRSFQLDEEDGGESRRRICRS